MSSANPFTVVPLRGSVALDIPQQLRNLANDIEQGVVEATHVIVAVEGSVNNRPAVWQLGESRPIPHAIGVLHAVIHFWSRANE